MILVGGGTGQAPLKSIMVHALGVNPEREIHLYHGVQGIGDLYDAELFREYASSFTNVSYIPVLSGEDWEGRTGHVTEVLLEDFESCKGYSGYLCGPPAMVEAGIKAFKRRRMAPRKIHREKFTAATPATELVATPV
jgi:NAD(P)H-flavin reductase